MTPGRNILIIDDEPQVLKLFSRLLSRAGYSVTAVSSGAEAFGPLTRRPFELLVLDLSMPQPDGFELLRRFRKERPGLRILVISGYMQGALLNVSECLGARASLSKTDAPKMLVKTVNALLR
jgi:CheY-like chemotaxis protein